MVRLRLRRMGRKKQPFYRIVAADSKSPRDGKFIEEIGWYNPSAKDEKFKYDEEKVKKWLSNGALPSETVKGIFIKGGALERDAVDPKTKRAPRAVRHPDKRRSTQPKEEAAAPAAEAEA